MHTCTLFEFLFSQVRRHGDSFCVCANSVVHVHSLPNDRVCMGSNKVFLVLVYHVLYATTLLPLPWNDDGVNHPKYPSGVHISIYVLHHTKFHVRLHCACTSKSFHLLYHVVCSIPFAHCLVNFHLVHR
jgi:hypothetical protein